MDSRRKIKLIGILVFVAGIALATNYTVVNPITQPVPILIVGNVVPTPTPTPTP